MQLESLPTLNKEQKRPTNLTRRRFLKRIGKLTLGGLFAGTGLFKYMTSIAPYSIEITHRRIDLELNKKGLAPLRVAHLSDLHESREVPLDYIQGAFEQVIQLKPDLVCLTGDYITNRIHNFKAYQATLRKLSAQVPTFACLGNHDGGKWYYPGVVGYEDSSKITYLLQSSGITVLRNASIIYKLDQGTFCASGPDDSIDTFQSDVILRITGLGDIYSYDCVPSSAFAEKNEKADVHLVLSHNPDSKAFLKSYDWDLMLSGHTHGGQIRIPLIGAPILPIRDRRFAEGLHRWEKRWIHVTRGVGNLHGFRLNCPPEISFLTLI